MTLLKKFHYQKCSEFVSKQVAVNTKTIVDRTKRQHAFHFQSLSMVLTQYAIFSVTMVCWLTSTCIGSSSIVTISMNVTSV